jgi:hypothetical protein
MTERSSRVTVIPASNAALQAVTTPYVTFEHPFLDCPGRLRRQADILEQCSFKYSRDFDWVIGDVWPNWIMQPHSRRTVRRALQQLPSGLELSTRLWPETVMYRTSAAKQFTIDERIKYRPQMAFWLQMYEKLGPAFIDLGAITTEAYIQVEDRDWYPASFVGAPTVLDKPTLPLTVLVVLSDQAETVIESMESLMAQSFSDFEVRVVDCSETDATWDAMRKIKDKRIVSYQWAQTGGEAAVLALNGSRGRNIALWDTATVSTPDRFVQQLELEVDISGCEYAVRRGDDIHPVQSGAQLHGSTTRDLAPFIPPSTMMFSRRLIESRGFDPHLAAEWAYAFQLHATLDTSVSVAKLHRTLVTQLDGAATEAAARGQLYRMLVRRDIMDQRWKESEHAW